MGKAVRMSDILERIQGIEDRLDSIEGDLTMYFNMLKEIKDELKEE